METTQNDSDLGNLIEDNLPNRSEEVDSDRALREDDIKALKNHNKQYTALLEAYVNNAKTVLEDKRVKKNELYEIIKKLAIGIPVLMSVVIILSLLLSAYVPNMGVMDVLPELVAALATVIATYITIVNLISEYLYNKEEEKTMATIISNIQSYDMNVRKRIGENADVSENE